MRTVTWPQLPDESGSFVDKGDIRVAKPVNRLLAIADDENRRRERIVGGSEPFTPARDQLPDQLPLRAARILEFVDQHVPVARLEPQPGLGKLVEILQQLDGAFDQTGKVDQRVVLERALIFGQRDGEDPPHATREHDIEIAPERTDGAGDGRRDPRRLGPVTSPRVIGIAVLAGKAGADESLAARFAVLRHEVRANPIDEGPERGLALARRQRRRGGGKGSYIRRQHRELRMPHRSIGEKAIQTVADAGQNVAQARSPRLAGPFGRQVPRPGLQETAQRLRGNESAVDERGDAGAQAPLAQLREHQGHVVILGRRRTANSKRPVERLAGKPRDIGFSRDVEPWVDVRFKRKFAQQRQAERVDCRNRDVAEPLPELAPAHRIRPRQSAGFLEPIDDALPHLGCGLARECDGENVIGLDAGAQQVDVPLHEDAGLSGAGGRFQHDVLAWIDRCAAGVGIGKPGEMVRLKPVRIGWVRLKPDSTEIGIAAALEIFGGVRLQADVVHIFERQARLKHRRRSPSGIPTKTNRSRTATRRPAPVETRHARRRRRCRRAAAALRRGRACGRRRKRTAERRAADP